MNKSKLSKFERILEEYITTRNEKDDLLVGREEYELIIGDAIQGKLADIPEERVIAALVCGYASINNAVNIVDEAVAQLSPDTFRATVDRSDTHAFISFSIGEDDYLVGGVEVPYSCDEEPEIYSREEVEAYLANIDAGAEEADEEDESVEDLLNRLLAGVDPSKVNHTKSVDVSITEIRLGSKQELIDLFSKLGD